ncbi:MAG: stage II sporulation protein M [Candidatus Aenigmarchaeota archaeon]|nr:stage II sporulation protein M [Candidatus Aenigmarchaeota archaeon]
MIESFVDLQELEDKPWLAFLWAFLLCSVAIVITSQLQAVQASFGFFAVVFTIIPSVLFLTLLITREEEKDEEGAGFWATHGQDVVLLLCYFFGLTLAFAAWTSFLPPEAFGPQVDTINQIRGTGAFTQLEGFQTILLNNLQVMVVAFVLSLVFGAGAIFIIVWNASVLGVYIGQISRSLYQIPLVSLSVLPHGIPEIGGYVLAGLAGGILSAAIMRKQHARLPAVFQDSLKLLALGVALIALGAAVEVAL